MDMNYTRRRLLGEAAIAAAALGTPAWARAATADAASARVGLPSGEQLRADIQRMVDMGPRYTGTAGHEQFVDWLEQELIDAGIVMLPRAHEPVDVWEATAFGLELLEGPAKGKPRIASYYPRSRETGPAGVTGHLVDAGAPPAPSLGVDLTSLTAALAAYPAALRSWAQSLGGTLAGKAQGSILLVDVPMPLPLLAGAFLPIATHLTENAAEIAAADYKRVWIAPGVTGIPTAPFKALGAAGIVFILDASWEALNGNYLPFENDFEDTPALFVDRDTGAQLRAAAATAPQARLTLQATRRKGTAPGLLGYLPGTSKADEAIFVDTHTDGEGFVEENGGVALVHLARHFAGLPAAQRLQRTLVFSLWPGHMAPHMRQLQGVIDDHPDIIRSSVAGITLEHLGCSEWRDNPDKGYHATGNAELFAVWTTQGTVFDIARAQTDKHQLPQTALLRPPVQFGVGGALQSAGVPQVGAIAGPTYLLRDSKDGDMGKFDAALAERQVAWAADLIRGFDAADAKALASGDPTLGRKTTGPGASFPPAALTLGARLDAVRRSAVKRTGTIHGRITINRAANVRVHATLVDGTHRRPLADRLLKLTHAGSSTFTLRLSRSDRRAIAAAGPHATIVLSARARDGEKTVTERSRRTVGR